MLQAQLVGYVNSETGEPLEGANVFLTELGIGDVTNADGYFHIKETLPAGSHNLQVSYIGYETYITQIDAKASTNLSITLKEATATSCEVIISSTRAGDRTPMTYSNITKEELEKNNLGQDVPFLLRWTPSTVVNSDAGAGVGYTGIWIRGSDPTRVNVTINGIPLNDAESQSVFWVDLPDFASSTEDIQIQRGVGASTNGASAFGASVNLNTNRIQRKPYVSMDGTVGSFNTLKGKLGFGTGLFGNGFSLNGRLSTIQSDGYIDRASADLNSWFLSGAWLGNKSSLRLNAFSGHEVTYQAWNGVDASLVDDPDLRTSNTAGTDKEGEPYENEVDDYQQTHYQLLFNTQLNPDWHLNLAAHYTKGQGFFEQYKDDEDLADYNIEDVVIDSTVITTSDLIRRRWLDNDFYGGTFSLHYGERQDRFTATLGGGFHIYEGRHFGEVIWARYAGTSEFGNRYYDNDAEKIDANIYAKFNYGLTDKLDAYLDLQYRHVGYDFLGVDNDGNRLDQDVSLSFFNPKFGFQYVASDRNKYYASFAIANKEPNRNDFTGSTPENRPEAEQLSDLEIGWMFNNRKSALQANIYYMSYKDQLVLNGQINDVGSALRINVDKSYRLGLELVGGMDITDNLHFTANTTLSQNKIESFTEYQDEFDADFNYIGQIAVKREDTDIAFSPNVTAAAEISYDFLSQVDDHDLSLALRGKYIGRRYLDNSSEERNSLDPYFFSDWQLQYTAHGLWAKKIRINLQLLNWLDELYESNGWSYRHTVGGEERIQQGLFPQAGRHIMLGIGFDF